ncbi:MAG: hypothetical protein IT462_01335 [Planctomycetes bacterium]|nr:hypothetical protein [Planctomycetota bacterium]
MEQRFTKPDFCPGCGRDTSSSDAHCIFCWQEFRAPELVRWRNVYHAYNNVDALLAKSALESHGVTVRIRDENASRMMLHGHGMAVVQAVEGEHLQAQEVLRQIRGVRTDTEFVEWQSVKHRLGLGRMIALGTLTALAALAACAAGAWLSGAFESDAPSERPARAR